MVILKRPLYQRAEGRDEDWWRLVLDTNARRLFVEHERKRGDARGVGYSTNSEELEVNAFLSQRDQGAAVEELMRVLTHLIEDASVSG